MPTPTRKTSAAAKLPYPELIECAKKFDWLVFYFRELAELQALKDLCEEMHSRKRGKVVLLALYDARQASTQELKKCLAYVVSDGLLPFAFVGTTVLDHPEYAL